MLKRISLWLIVLSVAVIGLMVATQYFIQPMNTDLSVIHQGKPSLVLAYENYSPDSGEILNKLNRIRQDYQHVMAFAVADLGNPEGLSFANRYGLTNGTAVFLSSTGQPIQVTILTGDEQDLRDLLDEKLARVGLKR